MLERLQKIIARAGVASRRHAEQLIVSGQVRVNGRIVTELGTKADAERDHIKVAGKLLHSPEKKIYLLLHKPDGVVATLHDPECRDSLAGLLRGVSGRVYPVGRLEYHSSGLMLLTNDGELANRILRSHRLPQTYWLKVKGPLSAQECAQIEHATGIKLRRLKSAPNPWYEATLAEASSDRLRSALLRLSHPVEKMKRMKLSTLELSNLSPGRYRELTEKEVAQLERAIAKAESRPRAPIAGGGIAKRSVRPLHAIAAGHSTGRYTRSGDRPLA